jgi:hypothetical protein
MQQFFEEETTGVVIEMCEKHPEGGGAPRAAGSQLSEKIGFESDKDLATFSGIWNWGTVTSPPALAGQGAFISGVFLTGVKNKLCLVAYFPLIQPMRGPMKHFLVKMANKKSLCSSPSEKRHKTPHSTLCSIILPVSFGQSAWAILRFWPAWQGFVVV